MRRGGGVVADPVVAHRRGGGSGFRRAPLRTTPGRIESQSPVVAREERDFFFSTQGWPERWPRGGEGAVRGGGVTRGAQLITDAQVLSHDGAMTPLLDRKETALKLARRKGLLRTGEAAAAGVDRSSLARLCEHGLLERLERGLYGLPAAAVREHVDLEIVAKRVPQAVFCLLTALRLHGLGTQQPRRVWISLPRGVHRPTLQFPLLEVIHVQPELHRLQVETLRSGPIRLKV